MNEIIKVVNQRAIHSLNRRMKTINDCRKGQYAALREPADAAKQREVQQLQEKSEHRLQALQKERQIRKELTEAQTRDRQQTSPIVRALLGHIKKYPLYYGVLKVASDPLFRCEVGLRKQQGPVHRLKMDLEGKKKRRKERFKLISDAKAKAAKMPDGQDKRALLKAAEDFRCNIDAAEKAVLSNDAYHYTDDQIDAEGAPTGYLRGSENPELLKRYGITLEMLQPRDSMFRAELYVPDTAVFGADAKPVIAFKGTDPGCLQDIKTDVDQALGKETDYYDRAIDLGKAVNDNTAGNFEFTGHSLGGGMASAAGVATGCQTTTFNPAGLHINTVAKYNKNVTTDASNISAFIVDGEILNSGQDASNRLGQEMTLSSAKSRLSYLHPVRLVPLLVGVQLAAVPRQAGARIVLPSKIGAKRPDVVSRHFMKTVISSIEHEKKKCRSKLMQSLLQPRRQNGTENVA